MAGYSGAKTPEDTVVFFLDVDEAHLTPVEA
jgi:hypothetical protein